MSQDFFHTTFGTMPRATASAPGRVNILGEHIDYNGGTVLPAALPIGVSVSLSPRTDGVIRIASDRFEGLAERGASEPARDHWSDYVAGAIMAGTNSREANKGADVAITSTLPFGSGISSSAAICVATLKALRDLLDTNESDVDIALAAQRVENDYIGVPCGIMDQMAVSVSAPGYALALDTRDLRYERLALPNDPTLCVIHSGVTRKLNEGRYAQRRAECDAAKAHLSADTLCHITPDQLSALKPLSDTLYRRARHCVGEQARVDAAIKALKAGDMAALGALLQGGHASIRDDFEITVPAIDALVNDAVRLGALGARQTGGGFGGCIVALIPAAIKTDWFEALKRAHPAISWVA